MPATPQRAPASWPAIAAVVSASSPRLAARNTASAKSRRPTDRPQRRLQGGDAVAGAADRRRLLGRASCRGPRPRLSGCSEPHCQNSGARTSSAGTPPISAAVIAPRTRHASTGRVAACVDRLDSAAISAASLGVAAPADRHRSEAHQRPVGCRLLVRLGIDGLPGALEPGQLAGESCCRCRSTCRSTTGSRCATTGRNAATGRRGPSHRYRAATPPGTGPSTCRRSTLLRASRNGPPPTMSLIGVNVPGDLNSSVVPTASPHARPSSAPTARSEAVTSDEGLT